MCLTPTVSRRAARPMSAARARQLRAALFIASLGVIAGSGCAFGGHELRPEHAPEKDWPTLEARMLTNVRQLTHPRLGISRAGEAYFSPDMRRIIFQAYPDGQAKYQMCTLELNPDGTSRPETFRWVSPGGGACTCGYFRPDGTGIIYGSSYLNPDMPNPNQYHRQGSSYTWDMPGGMDIITADLDGSNPRQLTTTLGYDAECAYSPSGESIVFASDRDGDADLYIMRADGTDVRKLVGKPGYEGGPFFSPEGQRVIFRADRLQNDNLQLFVINTDGTGERQLTSHSNVVNWAPYWHPNGRSIVWTTSIHGHDNYEVYLMNIETGAHRRVTFSAMFDGLPVFSPDGRWMMWTSKRGPDHTSQIFLADFALPQGY